MTTEKRSVRAVSKLFFPQHEIHVDLALAVGGDDVIEAAENFIKLLHRALGRDHFVASSAKDWKYKSKACTIPLANCNRHPKNNESVLGPNSILTC